LFDGDADDSGGCLFQKMLDFILENYVNGKRLDNALLDLQNQWSKRSKELSAVLKLEDPSRITPEQTNIINEEWTLIMEQ
jgi:hypothetical protein